MDSYNRNQFGGYINNLSVADLGNRASPNIMTNAQSYNFNNLNYSPNINQNPNYNSQIKKNISEITKLNYNIEKQNQNNNQITK